MPLSSSSLFHFSNSIDGTKNILQHGFRVSYSDEVTFQEVKGIEVKYRKAVPMVCFCDIPISLVERHANFYCNPGGDIFGIGLARSWAEKNGLNPVIYLSPDSYLSTLLLNSVQSHADIGSAIFGLDHLIYSKRTELSTSLNQSLIGLLEELKEASLLDKLDNRITFEDDSIIASERISRLELFIKQTKGKYLRRGKVIENHNFYNEREWRYIPNSIPAIRSTVDPMESSDALKFFDTLGRPGKKALGLSSNADYQKFINSKTTYGPNLKFTADDVSFIIVNNNVAAQELIESILDNDFDLIGGEKIPTPKSKFNLISRIISWEQVSEDILGN
ncbi:MAG TPA: abortive infection system antitoxin AbiGi family protein [Dyadobacter sp.]|jgi:hypothetical protein|nr:abortive infection system antitoxin AbiGi family protein [Dyadobacter sp.]